MICGFDLKVHLVRAGIWKFCYLWVCVGGNLVTLGGFCVVWDCHKTEFWVKLLILVISLIWLVFFGILVFGTLALFLAVWMLNLAF